MPAIRLTAAAALMAVSLARPGASQRPPLAACQAGRPWLLCGSVQVWENRAAARGRRLEIHVAVVRSETPGAHDAILVLGGGPGGGSIGLAGAARGWLRPLLTTHDLLFVDQRGTGRSHPLTCPWQTAPTPAAAFGHVFDPAAVARCRDMLSRDADLTKYTTDDAAADLEEVRVALGYARLSIYGGSYGTRLAQAYMRRFPTTVRSVVLDGVVPFEPAVPLTYAASAQEALERVWESCARSAACHAAHPSPASDFDRLLHRFDAGPLSARVIAHGAPVDVQFSRGDFAYAIRGMLYGLNLVPRLPDVVARAAASGDVSDFAEEYWSRYTVMQRGIAFGLHFSVFCSEDVPFASEADIRRATTGTFLGRYLIDEYRGACAEWPRGPIRSDARTPVSARVPTLLVSGWFDPVTPPEFAEQVRRSLPLAVTITAPAGSHGSATGCPSSAAIQVLDRGGVDDLPDVCRTTASP